jgi:hypothetical protein
VTEKGFKCVSPDALPALSLTAVFSEERVRKGAEKLQKYLNSKQQGRLDGFFTVKPKEKAPPAKGKGADKKGDAKGKGTKRKVCFLNPFNNFDLMPMS